MADILDEEIAVVLKETYLFHHLPTKFSDILDETLILIYMRLLHTYDSVNELSDNKSNTQVESNSNILKHVLR